MSNLEQNNPRPRFAPSYCCGPYPKPQPQPPRPRPAKRWCPCQQPPRPCSCPRPRPRPCCDFNPCDPCGVCGPACYPGMSRKVVIPAVLGDDSAGSDYAPREGMYFGAVVEYKANGAVYFYSGDGMFTKLKDGSSS